MIIEDFIQAWERGQEIRAKQDKVIALFIQNIRNIADMEALEGIEKQLNGQGEVEK